MTNQQALQRSIDTLQRIYAVVAGLAINEALKRVFLQEGKGAFDFRWANLPELLAFIITVVPFVHGMNRHLDKTLATALEQARPGLLAYLLIDFFVFIAESALLFVLAAIVTDNAQFFRWMLILLVVDSGWCLLTWPITRSVALRWVAVNLGVAFTMGLVMWCVPAAWSAWREWILVGLAIARTLLDYRYAWTFYFPVGEGMAVPQAATAIR